MILQVINSFNIGGAEKFVVEFSTQLKRTGEQVEILTFDRHQTAFCKILKSRGINIKYTLSENYLSPLNMLTFAKVMWSKRYSCIHTHLTYAQLWVSLVSLVNFRNKKLFTTEHSNNNNRRKYKFYKLVDKFIYSRYDRIFCISESTRISLLDWVLPFNASKYIIIPNCVDIEYFRNARSSKREDFGFKNTDKIILMVGRMSDAKDQSTIIRAIEQLEDDYKCLLVGDGEMIAYVRSTVTLLNKTFFTGTRLDVASLLKMCDIYVQSSHWEGMPTTVLEAMAAGKVVLGSKVRGIIDIVPKEQLFEEGNDAQLATMIKNITHERNQSILSKQENVVVNYSLSKITSDILRHYKQ